MRGRCISGKIVLPKQLRSATIHPCKGLIIELNGNKMTAKTSKNNNTNDMSEHEYHGEDPGVDMKWKGSAEKLKKFGNREALEYIGIEAFIPHEECVCCIDERVASKDILGGKDVGGRWFIAGSGILLPVENWEDRAREAAKQAKERGVKRFSYHAGCGAAKIAAEKDGINDPELHAENFVKTAQAELKRLYEADGERNNEEVIFITRGEVEPFDFHVALGAVVDTTSSFNPHKLKDGEPLKDCFMLDWNSGADLPPNKGGIGYNLVELKTAVSIAFEHGFGKHFDAQNKFNVVIMSFNRDELEEARKKIIKFRDTDLADKKHLIEVIPHLVTAPVERKVGV